MKKNNSEKSEYEVNVKISNTFNNIISNSVAFDFEWIPI